MYQIQGFLTHQTARNSRLIGDNYKFETDAAEIRDRVEAAIDR